MKIAEKQFGIPRNSQKAQSKYIETKSGKVVECFQFELQNGTRHLQVNVHKNTYKVIQVVNYIKNCFYDFVSSTEPLQFVRVYDPSEIKASPVGWRSSDSKLYDSSAGNNAKSLIKGKTVNFSTSKKLRQKAALNSFSGNSY